MQNKLHILFILLTFAFLFNTGLYAQDTIRLIENQNIIIDSLLTEPVDTSLNNNITDIQNPKIGLCN